MLPPSQRSSPHRQQSPRLAPTRSGSPTIAREGSWALGPESSAQSPSRPGHSTQMSVPSISVSQMPRQGGSQVHNRSSSMNAGSTPLRSGKPLSPLSTALSLGDGLTAHPRLRKQSSVASSLSSNRTSYKAYDPNEALDPAYLASSTAEYGPSPTHAQHRSRSGRS